MRIKFLSVIVSFLLMSIAISSCLDSDENYEYSSDATIRAFGIDSITKGVYYKFTIDQLKREIYNVELLPANVRLILDSYQVKDNFESFFVKYDLQNTYSNPFNSFIALIYTRHPLRQLWVDNDLRCRRQPH